MTWNDHYIFVQSLFLPKMYHKKDCNKTNETNISTMSKTSIAYVLISFFSSCNANKLRGANRINSQLKLKTSLEIKRQLLDVDSFIFIDDSFGHSNFDTSNNDILSLVNKIPSEREFEVYPLPQTFDSEDYVGLLEGLLPTPTKYHNDNFFLDMDIREHRYEQANVDVYGFVDDLKYDSMTSTAPQPINNDDLIYRLDENTSIVGLLGLLPGDHPLDSLSRDMIEQRDSYQSSAVFAYIDKIDPVFNRVQFDALTPMYFSNDWVGQLHGLLPGGTKYHNDDFFLSFANVEHKYDNLGSSSLIDVIDKVTSSDRVDGEAYKDLQPNGSDGRKIVGLLGLLPGSFGLEKELVVEEIVLSKLEGWTYKLSSSAFDQFDKIVTDGRVNPEAYEGPLDHVWNDGDYIGQLYGLLPDLDNKMQYLKYGWDELIGRDEDVSEGAGFVGMLDLIAKSKTEGVTMDGAESGNDVLVYLMTPNPTASPTTVPSASPSVSLSPTMSHALVICGAAHADCDPRSKVASLDDGRHAVRCCSDTFRPDWQKHNNCNVWSQSEIDGVCYSEESLTSANEICEGAGGRLCTEEEIMADCTRGSGCGFDEQYTWTSEFVTSPPTPSPTTSFSPTMSHALVICGAAHADCDPRSKVASLDDGRHAVRCCSDTFRPDWQKHNNCNVWSQSEIDGVCYSEESLTSANEICEGAGGRLCTEEEIMADCTRGSGCGFDEQYTWTSEFFPS